LDELCLGFIDLLAIFVNQLNSKHDRNDCQQRCPGCDSKRGGWRDTFVKFRGNRWCRQREKGFVTQRSLTSAICSAILKTEVSKQTRILKEN
jgi:hypothetical protein